MGIKMTGVSLFFCSIGFVVCDVLFFGKATRCGGDIVGGVMCAMICQYEGTYMASLTNGHVWRNGMC